MVILDALDRTLKHETRRVTLNTSPPAVYNSVRRRSCALCRIMSTTLAFYNAALYLFFYFILFMYFFFYSS